MRQVDEVRLGFVHERDGDRVLAVHAAERGFFFQVEADGRHVFQEYGAFGYDKMLQLGDLRVRRMHMNEITRISFRNIPCKHFLLRLTIQQLTDLRGRQVQRFTHFLM